MTSMSSALTISETNRLHRWAMWRMTVNEGIISCIGENGTMRVIYPDNTSDTNSLISDMSDFQEFPFITAEQMSLARKLNLREKYGSNHGLSDDAYFIFGLPRINIGKDIPEITSAGTRSVYENFSELGEAVNTSSRGMATTENNAALNTTYSELGPTPDAQSLASHNDMEVQRINGYREEGWKSPPPPVPHLSLYSIQEEFNNNIGELTYDYSANSYPERETTSHYMANHYPERETTNHYSSNPYPKNETTNCYSSNRFPETETTSHYFSSRYPETKTTNRYSSSCYPETETTNRNSSNRYPETETTNRYSSSHHQRIESTNHDLPDRYRDELIPSYSVRQAIDHYESVNRYASTSGPIYNTHETSNRCSSDHFNKNTRSPPLSPRQDVYPPFSSSRQNSRSPTRCSYSPQPSSPRPNYSSLPTSPMSYSAHSKQSYSPLLLTLPQKSSFPSGGGQGLGSPGYGNKMRPTRLLSDGETERLKRQAYYDWSTPTNERYRTEFGPVNPYR